MTVKSWPASTRSNLPGTSLRDSIPLRILSRLLDAQKSIQKREYSRKRKADRGKNYIVRSPGDLPLNFGERDYELRKDLIKALKEGYTKDYQELIKKYFEALVNESENN